MSNGNKMEKVVSLAKRRGFIFPGSEIYGGLANSWDFGPLGVELKNNLKKSWWKFFVQEREDIVGLDSTIIMNSKVWQASKHLKEFNDLLVECKECKNRFKVDDLENKKQCPNCGGNLSKPRQFNTMFRTFLGPIEDEAHIVYLRPETAQGMFVDFKQIQTASRQKIPFGIAQIGKAFRNEITPGNFLFRLREFEMMEIEYFIYKKDWRKSFDYWLGEIKKWLKMIGLAEENLKFHEIPEPERAHYSKRTVDIEYKFPFGTKELCAIAYRTNYDLSCHQDLSGQDLTYFNEETKEKFIPHVIEPTFGVERTILAILLDSYQEIKGGRTKTTQAVKETEIVLQLDKDLAPIKVAILPLVRNKPELVKKAKEVYSLLKPHFTCQYDELGSIGRRYRRQDEIGTPYCLTIDFESFKKQDVTVRDRDTMKQRRVKIKELKKYLEEKLK